MRDLVQFKILGTRATDWYGGCLGMPFFSLLALIITRQIDPSNDQWNGSNALSHNHILHERILCAGACCSCCLRPINNRNQMWGQYCRLNADRQRSAYNNLLAWVWVCLLALLSYVLYYFSMTFTFLWKIKRNICHSNCGFHIDF